MGAWMVSISASMSPIAVRMMTRGRSWARAGEERPSTEATSNQGTARRTAESRRVFGVIDVSRASLVVFERVTPGEQLDQIVRLEWLGPRPEPREERRP